MLKCVFFITTYRLMHPNEQGIFVPIVCFFMFSSNTTVAFLDNNLVFYVISRALKIIPTGYDTNHDCGLCAFTTTLK